MDRKKKQQNSILTWLDRLIRHPSEDAKYEIRPRSLNLRVDMRAGNINVRIDNQETGRRVITKNWDVRG